MDAESMRQVMSIFFTPPIQIRLKHLFSHLRIRVKWWLRGVNLLISMTILKLS